MSQPLHKMYSNNIVNFQESTTILKAWTKKSLENYWVRHVYIERKNEKEGKEERKKMIGLETILREIKIEFIIIYWYFIVLSTPMFH